MCGHIGNIKKKRILISKFRKFPEISTSKYKHWLYKIETKTKKNFKVSVVTCICMDKILISILLFNYCDLCLRRIL